MPLVKIKPAVTHRVDGKLLKAGEVFDASPAEMESFGDKFILAEDEAESVWTLVEDGGVGIGELFDELEVPVVEVEINATEGAFGLAEEHGISLALSNVVGTGAGGRIIKADVAAFLNNAAEAVPNGVAE